MTRQRWSGFAFIGAAIAFLLVGMSSGRRGVWVGLAVVFLVLGIGRLARSRPKA